MSPDHIIASLAVWLAGFLLAGLGAVAAAALIVVFDRARRVGCFVSRYSERVCERGTVGCVTDHGVKNG